MNLLGWKHYFNIIVEASYWYEVVAFVADDGNGTQKATAIKKSPVGAQ